ncbi:DUF1997 domain-containing protein [Phormidium sp. CLA17]|uniref:DUF1997 domain-containing protein n=1 Tax=Leptolyngbya sp. Cla-17 TaxID=2803751 RepID=UPI001490B8EC|nr:DUF1997 domain-containing protein [Leptolyngbya sp. Cla-17]MBM0741053.1 DUF1997 domain-containing protein [Leptolyngbya sp. Cla-17]
MDIQFLASQSVDIPVVDQPVPIQHYLRQPQRLIKALASSSQIEHLGNDLFRLKMRPLKFMLLSLQPTVDMKVWAESDGVVRLQSVHCEIRGVEYINQRLSLNLTGRLQVINDQKETRLKGKADLEVLVELPPPLWFTPKSILETTGNGLLKSVLLTIKQRLVYQLLSDYRTWAIAHLEDEISDQVTTLPAGSF